MIRIPLNQDCWLGERGLPKFGTKEGYRAAVQAFVTNLHEAGLATILDLHWLNPDGRIVDGQRVMADARTPTFWQSVATTFQNDRAMIFDLYNEPYSRDAFDLSWACWKDGG